jgi:hypothetical protein
MKLANGRPFFAHTEQPPDSCCNDVAGDCVHQRSGIRHYSIDYSPDMEYLEIVSPADFGTVDIAEGPCAVPAPGAWTDK